MANILVNKAIFLSVLISLSIGNIRPSVKIISGYFVDYQLIIYMHYMKFTTESFFDDGVYVQGKKCALGTLFKTLKSKSN